MILTLFDLCVCVCVLFVTQSKGDNPDVLVKGLMAAGEAACASVHGANRLGANSLLDIVVFGRAVANRTAQILKPGTPLPVIPASVGEESIANIDRVLHANGSLKTAEIRLNMQKTMQQYAAVFRTKDTLEIGAKKIEEVATQMKDMQVSDRSLVWNTDLIESLELQNLMTQVCTRHSQPDGSSGETWVIQPSGRSGLGSEANAALSLTVLLVALLYHDVPCLLSLHRLARRCTLR